MTNLETTFLERLSWFFMHFFNMFSLCHVKFKCLLMPKSHLKLFHTLKLSINFYMNEVLYLKSVKIIAKIKLNGKKKKTKVKCGKLFLNEEQSSFYLILRPYGIIIYLLYCNIFSILASVRAFHKHRRH